MEEIELTLEKTLPVWWAFVWRSTLVSMLAGFVLGGIGGFIVGASGNPQLGGTVGALLGWLASIPVSIWALKAALSKTYGNFSIALIKRS
ncbi:hypothetical protein UT4_20770 [Ferrigenium sp. UT4]